MKELVRSLLCAFFLSLALMPVAYGAKGYFVDLGGEDVSYDATHGALVPVKAEREMAAIGLLLGTISPPVASPQKPLIAIVIDDAGVDRSKSERAVRNLPAPVTLSYLAYAPHVQEQASEAAARGHEILLHLPWEADSEKADPGPHHLSVNMSRKQLEENLLANLDGFKGYTGVNNHMGSRFSRYREGLEVVMAELRKRGVFFLDSVTTPDSSAEAVARENGLAATHRDVFLDHVEKPEFVAAALRETGEIARHTGSVVAIGHPKEMTLAALEAWLPMMEAQGFQLVSMTTLMQYRQSVGAAHVAVK